MVYLTRMSNPDQLSEAFFALSHPVRRKMIARLANGQATVSQLAEPFGMSLPAISKHVKVLERAGLITQGREAQSRPCRLNREPIEKILTWAERYRPIWDERFDKMDQILRTKKGEADEC